VGMAGLVPDQRVEDAPFSESAIRQYVEDADMRARRIVDIHALLVRREAQTVRAGEILDQSLHRPVFFQSDDALPIEVTLDVIAFHAWNQQAVLHFGPVDRAVRLNADIVGRTELLSIQMGGTR